MDQAVNALEGKPVQANTASPLMAITAQNVPDLRVKPFISVRSCA